MSAVLLLCGATCSGKTELAVALAERFDAEIVGADSRQIYRGMSVGTAAPGAAVRARVPHHLVEFLDPHERYSAARFASDATAAIRDIHARGKRAIVVGGTGFYLRALAGEVGLSPTYDPNLRERLAREATVHPTETLHAWLASRDPVRAAAIEPRDAYRVTRALEIALGTDADGAREPRETPPTLRTLGLRYARVALAVDPATSLERIAARTDRMLAAGFVEEAERIGPSAIAADAVGYPHALAYLAGLCTADALRAHLVRATTRYAKRQRTWFRAEADVAWLAPDDVAAVVPSLLGWEPSQDALRGDRRRPHG